MRPKITTLLTRTLYGTSKTGCIHSKKISYWMLFLLVIVTYNTILQRAQAQTETSSCPPQFTQVRITTTERICEYTATLTEPFSGRPSQSPEGQRRINDAATECRRLGSFSDGGDRGADGVFVMCRVMLTQDEVDAMQQDEPEPEAPPAPEPTPEEMAEQEAEEQARQEQAERDAPFVFDVPEEIQNSPIASSIASSLVSVCEGLRQTTDRTPAQSDLLERCIDINREGNTSNKHVAIGQIAAQQYSDIGQSLNFLNTIQVGNIGGRLAAISPTLRQNARDVARAEAVHPDRGLLAGQASARQIGGAAGDSQDTGRFGAFVLGTQGDGDKDETALSRGFDYESRSMTLGIDYLWNPTLIVGLAYGYGDTESRFSGGTGSMDIRTDTFTAYLSKALKNQWSIDALAGVGDVATDNVRNMNFRAHNTTVDQSTRSRINSEQVILSLGVNRSFESWVDIDVSARFNYIRTDSDRFSEQIDGSAPGFGLALELDSNRIDSKTTDIAINFSRAFSTDWGVIIPQARVNWVREFEDDERFLTGRFLADTSTLDFSQSGVEIGAAESNLFRVPLESLDTSYGGALLGLSALLPNQLSLSSSINRILGISGFDHTYFSLTVRKDF